tara:strand:- start:1777 stop:2130 length:354 start_codon:yes stop_codon:yes gene_type:complete
MINNIQIDLSDINSSAQVGDWVYYVQTVAQGGFDYGSGNIILLGLIDSINDSGIVVSYNALTGPALPTGSDYIMFAKNPEVNTSRLLGYYMEVNFVNNSNEYAELFSVGSEVSENSK